MKFLQIMTGSCWAITLLLTAVNENQDGKMACFLISMISMIAFLCLSHLVGLNNQTKDITDEIIKNHNSKHRASIMYKEGVE